MKTNLLDLSYDELEAFVLECGEPKFRTAQLWQWMWQKLVADFDSMTNLAKSLREKLAATAIVGWPDVDLVSSSKDGTVKFLLSLHDGEKIETVLIPEKEHYTICLSTQVGCAMACTFCSTGTLGFTRNLTQSEILGQVLVARKHLQDKNDPLRLKNVVFMGMGEPMLNYGNLIKAIRTMKDDRGLAFGNRSLTVSTVGIPNTIIPFGELGEARLAISLHAPTQELREQLVPRAARAMPMNELMDDLRNFPMKPRDRITIEYILIKELNDTPEHARQLLSALRGIRAKVNLIAFNGGPDSPYREPGMERIEAFEKVLWDNNMTVILRKSKGRDIEAACGQLAARDKQQNC